MIMKIQVRNLVHFVHKSFPGYAQHTVFFILTESTPLRSTPLPLRSSPISFLDPCSALPGKNIYLQLVTLAPDVIAVRYRRLHRLHDGADLALNLFGGGRRLLSQFLLLRAHVLGLGVGGSLTLVPINPVLAVLLHELHQIFHGAGARVGDGIGFVARREQFDGGETLDLIRDVIERRIHFGNGHFRGKIRVALIQKSKLFVLGSQPRWFGQSNYSDNRENVSSAYALQ